MERAVTAADSAAAFSCISIQSGRCQKAPLRSAMTAGVARAGAVGARPGAVKAMAAAAMA